MPFFESLEGRCLFSVVAPAAEAADQSGATALSVAARRPKRAAAAPVNLVGDWSGSFEHKGVGGSIAAHVPVQSGKRFELWLYFDTSVVPSSHINPGNDAICTGTVTKARRLALKGEGWIRYDRIRITARGRLPQMRLPRGQVINEDGLIEGRFTLVVQGRRRSGEFRLSKTPATAP